MIVPIEHITSFLYTNEKKKALQYSFENKKDNVNIPCEYITKKHEKKKTRRAKY